MQLSLALLTCAHNLILLGHILTLKNPFGNETVKTGPPINDSPSWYTIFY